MAQMTTDDLFKEVNVNVLWLDSVTELHIGRDFEIVLANMDDGAETEDRSLEWLRMTKGTEIVVSPEQMEVLGQEADQRLWDEVEARLDDWPAPDIVPGSKVVGSIMEGTDPKKEFWKVWNAFQGIFRENLRYADEFSAHVVVDKMQQFDWWAQDCHLWSDPPSMINELAQEVQMAMNRPIVTRPKPSQLIAAGKFQRVVVDGIVHIILTKEVDV